tara:strand:- start:333 stop:908 length:576 start_codon:yes stop_codon:yes gene_type:complete
MSDFSDFFPAAGGGGGGGIPKYQEFTSSGTFTPTQALIDAGGRLAYFIVGGGAQGANTNYGGAGGGVEYGYMTLTSINSCITTLGAAGGSNAAGGSSSVIFSSAGGTDVTALGAQIVFGYNTWMANTLGASWSGDLNEKASPGTGLFGYGAGGGRNKFGTPGVNVVRANSGQGSPYQIAASAGFIRLTWFE